MGHTPTRSPTLWRVIIRNPQGQVVFDKEYSSRAEAAKNLPKTDRCFVTRCREQMTYLVQTTGDKK